MSARPLHVLFVTGEYPPWQGGVGAYTAELSRALAGLGVQASVLTSAAVGLDPTVQPEAVVVFPLIQRWDWRIWSAVDRQAAACGADWIHVQYQTAAFSMHPAINLGPARWRRRDGRRDGRRIAWTYHDLRVPYLFPKAGERLRRWVTKRPLASSDLIVVTNEEDRLALADRTPAPAKIPIGSNIQGRAWTPEQRVARAYFAATLGMNW
ncbi:MAG: glycosyltransferase family 4 protein [Caldilineaceae bacterium]|nr:glycosyltransferase family 4 protein [Caldilineaceae bacterium]